MSLRRPPTLHAGQLSAGAGQVAGQVADRADRDAMAGVDRRECSRAIRL